MESGINITAYDVVVVGLFALFIGRGIWLGFLRQVTGLVALYLGYIISSQYHDKLFPFLRDISDNPKVVFLASYVVLFLATYLVVMLIGKALAYVIQLTITGWFDRILGGGLGLAKAFIVVVLLHMILGTILAPDNQMLRNCQTCSILKVAVDKSRQLIRSEDVRKAMKQKEPAISLDTMKKILSPTPPPSEATETPTESQIR